jgi:hypothetical protein
MTHFDDLAGAMLRGSVRKKETAPMPGAERRLVLVLGPGRSGTSTMAGVLSHCGYVVPDPIEPEESNPAGFFEPRWVNDFHLELLERADVRPLDSDPGAAEVVAPLMTEVDVRTRLRKWLAAQLDQHERLVVKDPRLVWFRDLWVSVAGELGQEPASVVMLRHPSEVSSSRSEFYHSRVTTAVAGWINVALLAERVTRGSARAVVPYADLMVDWRSSLTGIRDRLGLRLQPGPDDKPHPADDFVDPGLRRHHEGWEDSPVPLHVRSLADAVFDALGDVVRDDVPAHESRLDALHDEYAALHAGSFDVVRHQVMRERRQSRRSRRQAKQLASGKPRRRPS